MKAIAESPNNIRNIWGKQSVQTEETYRLMKYVLRAETGDGVLLHNVVTGKMVLLSAKEAQALETLPAVFAPWMEELIVDRYLVSEAYDEHKSVLQLRTVSRTMERMKPKYITGYTILPTTFCNARCFYCYEADYHHVHMTAETAHRAVEFIQENCGPSKKISLNWFGGEPTVGAERIDQICRELQEAGIEYSGSMISNGYLLNSEMADRAKQLWKLNMVQITLDGTEEVYNRVKAYHAVTGSPYQQVMQNIAGLLEREIVISIRMNMDRHNVDNLRELIEELASRFGGNKYFSAYVHTLFDDCGFDPVSHTEEDHQWLAQKEKELNALIQSHGMYHDRELSLPCFQYICCMSDQNGSVIINPDGGLAKCEHYVNDLVGDLWNGVDQEKAAPYFEVKEEEVCRTCPLFPKCVLLKVCLTSRACDEAKLATTIQNGQQIMKDFYQNWKKEQHDVE